MVQEKHGVQLSTPEKLSLAFIPVACFVTSVPQPLGVWSDRYAGVPGAAVLSGAISF